MLAHLKSMMRRGNKTTCLQVGPSTGIRRAGRKDRSGRRDGGMTAGVLFNYLFQLGCCWGGREDRQRRPKSNGKSKQDHHGTDEIGWEERRRPLFWPSEALNQSVTNILEYSNIFLTNIFSDIHSYQFFRDEYIQTFVCVKFSNMNIFGYSFVSV